MLSTQLGSGDPAVNQQQLSQRAASEKEAAPERRQDLWTGASGQSSRPTDPRLLPFSQVPPLVHDTVPLDIGSDRSAAVTPRHVPPPSPQAGRVLLHVGLVHVTYCSVQETLMCMIEYIL